MMLQEGFVASQTTLLELVLSQKRKKRRSANEIRWNNCWELVYQVWSEKSFKEKFRVTRATFEFVLGEIEDDLGKELPNCHREPISPAMQSAVCLYRLAHGCDFGTVADLFGISKSTACVTFNTVCKLIARRLNDRFVYTPKNRAEWKEELRGSLENWEFPCVGAWDGFHAYGIKYTYQELF